MINYLDKVVSYLQQGTEFIRGILMNIAGFLSLEERFGLTIFCLVLAAYLGYFLVRKLVVNPLRIPYLIYYLIITLLIFVTLMYF